MGGDASREGRRRRAPRGRLRQDASNEHEEARRIAGASPGRRRRAWRPIAGGSARRPPTSTGRRIAGKAAPDRHRIYHLAANEHEL